MQTQYTENPAEAIATWTAHDDGHTTAIFQATDAESLYAIGHIDQMIEAQLDDWELVAPEEIIALMHNGYL